MSRLETLMELADCARKDAYFDQWDDPARNDIPVPEGFDEAWLESLEREARRAELEGLSVCGDDEWGRR